MTTSHKFKKLKKINNLNQFFSQTIQDTKNRHYRKLFTGKRSKNLH